MGRERINRTENKIKKRREASKQISRFEQKRRGLVATHVDLQAATRGEAVEYNVLRRSTEY